MSLHRDVSRLKEENRELRGKVADMEAASAGMRTSLERANKHGANGDREILIFAGKLDEEYIKKENWKRRAKTTSRLLEEYNAQIGDLRNAIRNARNNLWSNRAVDAVTILEVALGCRGEPVKNDTTHVQADTEYWRDEKSFDVV